MVEGNTGSSSYTYNKLPQIAGDLRTPTISSHKSRKTSAKWRKASCYSRRGSPNGEKPLANRGDVRQMVEKLLQFAERFAKWRKGSCSSRNGSPNGGKALAVRGEVCQMVESLLQFAERFAKWRKASCSSRRLPPFGNKLNHE